MRELTWSEPLKTTSPPRPPSPPSGPPSMTRASRRNDADPSPPLPERTWTTTWSMNVLTDAPSVCTVTAFHILCCLYLTYLCDCDCWSACTNESDDKLLVEHLSFCTASVAAFWYRLNTSICINGDESSTVYDLDLR